MRAAQLRLFGWPVTSLLSFLGLALATIVLPVAAIFSTRSSVLVLSLASVCLLLARLMARQGRAEVVADMSRLLRSPLFLCIAAGVLAAYVSTGWAAHPAITLEYATRLLGNVVLGLAFALAIPGQSAERVLRFLFVGLALAFSLLLVELDGRWAIRPLIGARPGPDAVNRAVLTASVLAFTALGLAVAERKLRLPALLLSLAAVFICDYSASQTSLIFVLVALLALPFALWLPRFSAIALTVLGIFQLAAFPFLIARWGDALGTFMMRNLHDFAVHASVPQRIKIWSRYAPHIEDKFWLGWGYATERPTGPVGPDTPFLSPVGMEHPHDIAIQIWVDFGVVGFGLAALALIAYMFVVLRSPRGRQPGAVMLMAGILAVWMISHGAFQEWWLALIALAFTLHFRTSGAAPADTAAPGPEARSAGPPRR